LSGRECYVLRKPAVVATVENIDHRRGVAEGGKSILKTVYVKANRWRLSGWMVTLAEWIGRPF